MKNRRFFYSDLLFNVLKGCYLNVKSCLPKQAQFHIFCTCEKAIKNIMMMKCNFSWYEIFLLIVAGHVKCSIWFSEFYYLAVIISFYCIFSCYKSKVTSSDTFLWPCVVRGPLRLAKNLLCRRLQETNKFKLAENSVKKLNEIKNIWSEITASFGEVKKYSTQTLWSCDQLQLHHFFLFYLTPFNDQKVPVHHCFQASI